VSLLSLTRGIQWAAVAKVLEGKGAKYVEDCREGHPFSLPKSVDGKPLDGEAQRNWLILNGGYFPHAFDEEAEKRLWEVSCEMVGVRDS
jgi:hypothetical protein